MPTGYTHAVQDGSITELKDFALQCARAFGALILMRDEPNDAEIPDEFQPSDYNKKALDAVITELETLGRMTPAECDAAALNAFNSQVAARNDRIIERQDQSSRYAAMRSKVGSWVPPTPDHVELRDFMLDQLDQSIRFDCIGYEEPEPVLQTGDEWVATEKARIERAIRRHATEHEKELERTAQRNAWIKALRQSLAGTNES